MAKSKRVPKSLQNTKKFKDVVDEEFNKWSNSKLHSGSKHGPIVRYEGKRSPQAIAISLQVAAKKAKKTKKRKNAKK